MNVTLKVSFKLISLLNINFVIDKTGMPEYDSTPKYTAQHFCRRQKQNKMHGKVAAKTGLVLKHVAKWFLVLLWPFSG